MIGAIAERVAATPFAEWAMASAWAYPVANTVHVLALVLLLGGIGLVDLRVLGLFRSLPLRPLWSALVPVAAAGVLILAASGSVLFAADAVAVAESPMFRIKLGLIAAALANVVLFRLVYGRAFPDPAPGGAQILAMLSLCLWTGTAIAGRWIAYS